MNYLKTAFYSTLFVSSASIAAAQTTSFTVDNLRYVNSGGPFFETASAGSVIINPDNGFVAPINNVQSGPLEIELRLTGLDLDGVGTDDDYINFSLRATPGESSAQIVVSNQGIGQKNSSVNINDTLNPGEEILLEVVNLSAGSTGAAITGAVTFDGFTAAAFGGGTGANKVATSSANINGQTVTITATGTDSYQYKSNAVTLDNVSSVLFDNITTGASGDALDTGEIIDATLSNKVRTLSFGFTYDPAGTETVEPTYLTTNNLGLRDNATLVYPTNPSGGASTGQIIPNPDQPFTNVPAGQNIMDVPLRWTGIDLDDDGVADDYFDFTLRAYDENGTSKARLSGPAWGANSGANWGLDGDEGLIFTVANIVPSADAVGSVEFVGFTQATILGVATGKTAGEDAEVNSSVSLDINGTTVEILLSGVGYTSAEASLDLGDFGADLPTTVTVNNPVLTPGTIAETDNPGAFPRSFDLKFKHNLSGTQAVAPTYEFANQTYLIYNRSDSATGFSAIGSQQQEFVDGAGNSLLRLQDGETMYAWNHPTTPNGTIPNGPEINIPMIWENIDVDGDGSIAAGESITFTVRYSANGNAVIANDGVHVNGNGPSNNSIDGTESLTIQVLDVVANGISEGAVSFIGFDQINTIILGNAGADQFTTGFGTIDVNGTTLSGGFDTIGYTNTQPAKQFIPPATSLTFNNPFSAEIGSYNEEYAQNNTVVAAIKARGLKMRFGYSVDAVAPAIPDSVISINNISIRGNMPAEEGAAGNNYVISEWDSSVSSGAVAAQPNLTTADLVLGNAVSFPMRWTGDLNADGTDDYIDFDVVATAGGEGTVYIGGEGVSVNPGYGFQAGESVTYTIENLVVDPAVGGTATSGGFTSGKFIASGNGGTENSTTGTFNGDVAGNTVSISIDEPFGGYKNVQAKASVAPAVEALLFDNFSTGEVPGSGTVPNTIAPNAHIRSVSFSINYFEAGETTEPEPETPATPVVTNSGFVDADTFYIEFTPGGTGYKVTTPTNGGLDFAGGTTDVTTSTAPAGADDNRFEFDPAAGQNFFRIESE
ncbi:MAG: hypothetical protein ACON46_02025 [Coraliomargaritaceae bacterium]